MSIFVVHVYLLQYLRTLLFSYSACIYFLHFIFVLVGIFIISFVFNHGHNEK